MTTTTVDPTWFRDPAVRDRLVASAGRDGDGVGAAAMWLHGAGRDHLLKLADRPAGPEDVLDHMARLDIRPLVRALGDSAAELNYEAAAGARGLLRSFRGAGVPWPLAVRRAAAAYGADAGSLRGFVQRMSAVTVPPQVVDDEGLRVVCDSAVRRSSAVVAKEWVEHPEGRRWVNRDEEGQFAEQSSGETPSVREVDGRLVMVGEESGQEVEREAESPRESAPALGRESLKGLAQRSRSERLKARKERKKAKRSRRAGLRERAEEQKTGVMSVSGTAKVKGAAQLKGAAKLKEKAQVRGAAQVREGSKIKVRRLVREKARLRVPPPPPPEMVLADFDPPVVGEEDLANEVENVSVLGPGAGWLKTGSDMPQYHDVLDNSLAIDVPVHIVLLAGMETLPHGNQRGERGNSPHGSRLNMGAFYHQMQIDDLWGLDPLRRATRQYEVGDPEPSYASSTLPLSVQAASSAAQHYRDALDEARSYWNQQGRDNAPDEGGSWTPELRETPYRWRRYAKHSAVEEYARTMGVSVHAANARLIQQANKQGLNPGEEAPYTVDLPVIRMLVTNIPMFKDDKFWDDSSMGMPAEWVDIGLGGTEWSWNESGRDRSVAGAGAFDAALAYREILAVEGDFGAGDVYKPGVWREALQSEFGPRELKGHEFDDLPTMVDAWNALVERRITDLVEYLWQEDPNNFGFSKLNRFTDDDGNEVWDRGDWIEPDPHQHSVLLDEVTTGLAEIRNGEHVDMFENLKNTIRSHDAFTHESRWKDEEMIEALAGTYADDQSVFGTTALLSRLVDPDKKLDLRHKRGYHKNNQAIETVDTPVYVPLKKLMDLTIGDPRDEVRDAAERIGAHMVDDPSVYSSDHQDVDVIGMFYPGDKTKEDLIQSTLY